jgi:hypothetical protein
MGVSSIGSLTDRVLAMLRTANANEPGTSTIKVPVDLEWDQRSKGTIALVNLLKRCPEATRKQYAAEIAKVLEKVTSPISNMLEFWMPEEDIAAVNDSFFVYIDEEKKGEKMWLSVVDFLEKFGAARVIGVISGALARLTNLADDFNGSKVPSIAQWNSWLNTGRAMRKREPGDNINKEYAELPGYSAGPRGASTSRKNEKSLEILQDFFPDCECDIMHYVGITHNDHMVTNNWQYWMDVNDHVREKAEATFFGFDIKNLKAPLQCDEHFELKSGVNFREVDFADLVTEKYDDKKSYFLYNDAHIIHADKGESYNPNNPFHRKGVPEGWPALVAKADFATATPAEKGTYNYLSWCAAKYKYGVVKFHLDTTVSHLFWDVVGRRFLTKNKEFMIWKCGRLHNLEMHCFFGTREPVTPTMPPPGAMETMGDVNAPLVIKKVATELEDRFQFIRAQAIIYWICLASYTEIHRNFIHMNPLLDLSPKELNKLEREEATTFARMCKARLGYTDHSYNPKPVPIDVEIDGHIVKAIPAYLGATKRLNTGISSVLNSEAPAIAMARQAMEAAKRDAYVSTARVASMVKVTTAKGRPGRNRFFRKVKSRSRSGSVTPPQEKKE